MEIDANSPNGCWLRNGYVIEREGKRRRIYTPTGDLIFDHASSGYEDEMAYIKEHNLLTPTPHHITN
ncbi:hypothetical protein ACP3TB_21590 (plasmid) [Rahnella variigena]|uniref:hypothetical protein n=1 Tax=Rahnella variigena TaxID=574964 RepID=UPI003CEE9E7A